LLRHGYAARRWGRALRRRDRREDDLVSDLLGGELHLVAGTQLRERRGILDRERHRHPSHAGIWNIAVLQRHRLRRQVDTADFAVDLLRGGDREQRSTT
jgi:hypothetical protein